MNLVGESAGRGIKIEEAFRSKILDGLFSSIVDGSLDLMHDFVIWDGEVYGADLRGFNQRENIRLAVAKFGLSARACAVVSTPPLHLLVRSQMRPYLLGRSFRPGTNALLPAPQTVVEFASMCLAPVHAPQQPLQHNIILSSFGMVSI
jgi:hypothetical protein